MKLSLITVCRNAQETIERTFLSVLKQKANSDMEYIVVDGDSQDLTMVVVDKYRRFIDTLISEPDHGIYDAMNKGIRLAKGDYVLFLNADDQLADGFGTALENIQDKDYYFGAVLFWTHDGVPDHLASTELDAEGKIAKSKTCSTFIPHQGLFLRRDLALKHPLNTDFRVWSDFDLELTLLEQNYSYEKLNALVAHFHGGGVSSVFSLGEYAEVLSKHVHFFRNRLSLREKKLVYRGVQGTCGDASSREIKSFLAALELPWHLAGKEKLLRMIDRVLRR